MVKHVVLGVTGGIAAYKSCEVVSTLGKHGVEVDVIMTHNATQLVQPLSFEALSKRPVTTDTFSRTAPYEVSHIALAQKADVMVVAPATANVIAKLAHGIADDMLTTTLLATKAPILIAPAMNTAMWEAEATQKNIALLKSRGVHFVGPADGLLACGDVGSGRMSEPSQIVNAIIDLLNYEKDMQGLKVLVTAGASVERIDPVRYLTNDSSGKMGIALATDALRRGANVTLVLGKTSVAPPSGMKIVPFTSTNSLLEIMLNEQDKQDIIVQAAAPADYTPLECAKQKLKKQGNEPMSLTLVQTPDVAKAIGEKKREGQVLVGFAAETEHAIENGKRKLIKKNLDMIVVNDVTAEGAGFGSDTNIVTIVTEKGQECLPVLPKTTVARHIWTVAMQCMEK